jgi:hypothetical protein
MKMRKLNPVERILSTDFIKAEGSQKVVPVTITAGFKVADLDLHMDPDFEGFYRAEPGDSL